MRPAPVLGLLLTSLLLSCASAGGGHRSDPLAPVRFLAGRWTTEDESEVTTERWVAVGDRMLGEGKTEREGRVVQSETMSILVEDGRLIFVAAPGGHKPTRFPLVESGPGRAVFENPTHDFPQRVIYALQPDGVLLATIEGAGAEQARKVEWRYVRLRGAPSREPRQRD